MLDRLAPSVVLLGTFAYAVGIRRLWAVAGPYRIVTRAQALAFGAAIVVLLVALASPLDAAADRDLPLHMVQHVLLLAVVPPAARRERAGDLVHVRTTDAVAAPRSAIARPVTRSQATGLGWLVWTAGSFALATLTLALWHVPALYDAAVGDGTIHAFEHVTFVGTATLFWWMALGGGRRARRGVGVIAVFVATLPATALGRPHDIGDDARGTRRTATAPTRSRDQQVAGAVMWGFGGARAGRRGAGLFAGWLAAMDRADQRADEPIGGRAMMTNRVSSAGSTTASGASQVRPRRRSTRSSPTTGRSCSARSRCTASWSSS